MAHILSGKEVLRAAETAASNKVAMPLPRLILLGIAAGAYIALGGGLASFMASGMPGLTEGNPALTKLLSGAFFPIGLILIVLVGGELFTGNAAYMTVGVFRRKVSMGQLLWNWLLVWCANFLGALLCTYLFFELAFPGGLFASEPWHSTVVATGEAKAGLPWGEAFVRGIGANWLVCLALWLGNSSDSMLGKLVGLWWPIMTFVALGFEHSIANMFYLPIALFEGADFTLTDMLLGNLLPVTLGNIVGGGLFVALLYAYVYNENDKLRQKPLQ